MKVIQVCGGPVYGTLGGREYVIRKLSEKLSKHGFEVEVLCPGVSKNPVCHKADQIKYIEIPSYRLRARLCLPGFSSLRRIVQNLKEADLVHAHCPDNPFVFFSALVSRFLHKPLITTVLAYADDFKHHDKINRMFGIFTAIQQTVVVWISYRVHVENPYDADKLHVYKHKVVVIPPGIENHVLTGIPCPRTVQIVKDKIKYQKEESIVLFLGRTHKAKGVNHAISAVGMLRKAGYRVKLVIAGPSKNFPNETKKHAKDFESYGIVHLGKVTDKEKVALIDIAGVIIIPSLSDVVEAYSLVASEAWARRKLVVAYAVGALKYRVRNGVNGYLARAMDRKELAKKIAMALSQSADFNVPSDVWNWNKVADQYKLAYLSSRA